MKTQKEILERVQTLNNQINVYEQQIKKHANVDKLSVDNLQMIKNFVNAILSKKEEIRILQIIVIEKPNQFLG